MHIKLILDPAYVLCFSQTAVSDVSKLNIVKLGY